MWNALYREIEFHTKNIFTNKQKKLKRTKLIAIVAKCLEQ